MLTFNLKTNEAIGVALNNAALCYRACIYLMGEKFTIESVLQKIWAGKIPAHVEVSEDEKEFLLSCILIIGAYEVARIDRGYALTLYDIYKLKQRFLVGRVDYSEVAFEIREHPEFSYDIDILGITDKSKRELCISAVGYNPISLSPIIGADDLDRLNQAHAKNVSIVGPIEASLYLHKEFQKARLVFPSACRQHFFGDQQLPLHEYKARVFRVIDCVTRDFNKTPSISAFELLPDYHYDSRVHLDRWLDEAASPELFSGVKDHQNPYFKKSVREYEKVVAHLVKQGANWAAPLLRRMAHGLDADFESRRDIAESLPEKERVKVLLGMIASKPAGSDAFFLHALVKALPLITIYEVANQEQLGEVYRITQNGDVLARIRSSLVQQPAEVEIPRIDEVPPAEGTEVRGVKVPDVALAQDVSRSYSPVSTFRMPDRPTPEPLDSSGKANYQDCKRDGLSPFPLKAAWG